MYGQYRVVERIAIGGMAEIYLGMAKGVEGFERQVVIKKVRARFSQDDRFRAMLVKEAKITASLSHPNIVQILDLGQNDKGEYFIVMEYVDGKDLRSIIDQTEMKRMPLDVNQVLFIAAEMCAALSYAHRKTDDKGHPLRLVHRDVSPSNVLISRAGEVKLTDFGIARYGRDVSLVGSLKGKLAYMSPEQARAEPLDHRTDIFSLGAVMFEILLGRRVFAGESDLEMLAQVRDGRVTLPSNIDPDIPLQLEQLLLRALAPDPGDRFQGAEEMGAAVRQFQFQHASIQLGAKQMTEMVRRLFGEEERLRRRSSAAPVQFTINTMVGLQDSVRLERQSARFIDAKTSEAEPSASLLKVLRDDIKTEEIQIAPAFGSEEINFVTDEQLADDLEADTDEGQVSSFDDISTSPDGGRPSFSSERESNERDVWDVVTSIPGSFQTTPDAKRPPRRRFRTLKPVLGKRLGNTDEQRQAGPLLAADTDPSGLAVSMDAYDPEEGPTPSADTSGLVASMDAYDPEEGPTRTADTSGLVASMDAHDSEEGPTPSLSSAPRLEDLIPASGPEESERDLLAMLSGGRGSSAGDPLDEEETRALTPMPRDPGPPFGLTSAEGGGDYVESAPIEERGEESPLPAAPDALMESLDQSLEEHEDDVRPTLPHTPVLLDPVQDLLPTQILPPELPDDAEEGPLAQMVTDMPEGPVRRAWVSWILVALLGLLLGGGMALFFLLPEGPYRKLADGRLSRSGRGPAGSSEPDAAVRVAPLDPEKGGADTDQREIGPLDARLSRRGDGQPGSGDKAVTVSLRRPVPKPKPSVRPVPKPKPTVRPVPKPKPTVRPVPRPKPTVRPVPKPKPTVRPVPKPKPTVKPVPRPKPTVRPVPKPKPAGEAAGATGQVVIKSDPWAYIYVDGNKTDRTTSARPFPLPAGRHRIELVNPALGLRKTLVIDLPAGGLVRKFVPLK
jgi:serine/threonine protein kinase